MLLLNRSEDQAVSVANAGACTVQIEYARPELMGKSHFGELLLFFSIF
jgi:hypothetical protein